MHTGIAMLFILLYVGMPVSAQRRNTLYNKYIKEYAPLAIEQMDKYKIPASITLAQGLLESGAGVAYWPGRATITSASSVTDGREARSIMTMTRKVNVSGPIARWRIPTRTTPNS